MPSFNVSKSTGATTAATSTITTARDSQPELAVGQHHQGSFAGRSTTVHTPESSTIAATYHQRDELRLLSDMSTTQLDPFEELATHPTATFDNDDLGQFASASSLSPSDESSQPVVGEARSITTIGIPVTRVMSSINDHFYQSSQAILPVVVLERIINLTSSQYPTKQGFVLADKWVILTSDADMPFQCVYEGCGKLLPTKRAFYRHFAKHSNDSQLRCYLEDCSGAVRYSDNQALTRHVQVKHTFERLYQCEVCDKRFRRIDHLRSHMVKIHSVEDEKKTPKRKKK